MMTDMEPKNLLRVALTSDQPIFLRGLASLLMAVKGMTLIGEARSGAEAVQLCQIAQPDLMVLDLRNSIEHRRETAAMIRQHWPEIKLVFILDQQEENETLEDNETGHVHYLARDISEEEFKSAFDHIRTCPATNRNKDPMSQSGFNHNANEPERPSLLPTDQLPRAHMVRNEEILVRELVMASKIQEDILPEEAPHLAGWDISVRLKPARETSGDFYDFIPLTDRKWGIVVADVTDKGMGAALFMALSSTLIRTYATRFPSLPAYTMNCVNDRMLADTRGSNFVTTFFGILEPHTGRFIYSNAGHPPGYIISTRRGKESIQELRPTGMALGASEEGTWKQKIARLNPGDFLVLYTDGITEAQNAQGDFFGDERLLDTLLEMPGSTAQEIQNAILAEVRRFVGSSPQQDDIALIVIRREE
jgi:DNA-binding NarL/FixJ family response regulator